MTAVVEDVTEILNVNVGVLGHVDSGKTSLVKTLSSLLSTASLDKSVQSRQRGITLDLGFSAFMLDTIPCQITESDPDFYKKYKKLQITLVDCPGHASLIRTIIGGAQIIDMMILVVDATKGIQTQTAECLVIAEMTTRNLIIALNKIDLFQESERMEKVRKVEQNIRKALKSTRFANAPMVGISACVGGEKVAAAATSSNSHSKGGATPVQYHESTNIEGLLELIKSQILPPNRHLHKAENFHFAIDHCFPIKGKGTVVTGTVLSGSAKPNDIIHFPELGLEKKIKSMQMFRRPCNEIRQGDRAGICLANLDAKLIERGIACSPGSVSLISGAVVLVKKVKYFHGKLPCNSKFHVSVGHTTVMASVTFFGARELLETSIANLVKTEGDNNINNASASLGGADTSGLPRLHFDFDTDFVLQDELIESFGDVESIKSFSPKASGHSQSSDCVPPSDSMPLNWAIVEFQTPVFCPMNSLIIGSRLDTDIHANTCRLAFSGRLIEKFDSSKDIKRLKFYSRKEKEGKICRLGDPYKRSTDGVEVCYDVIATDLFGKGTNMNQFIGLKLETKDGDIGIIQSAFGTSGKFKVKFPAGTTAKDNDTLYLRFKRYTQDEKKAMNQDDIKVPTSVPGTIIERTEPVGGKKKKKEKKKKEQFVEKHGTISTNGTVASVKGDDLEGGKKTVAIVSGFFSPEVNVREKIGWKVLITTTGEEGEIQGPFGKAGKCKVFFSKGISTSSEGSKAELSIPSSA